MRMDQIDRMTLQDSQQLDDTARHVPKGSQMQRHHRIAEIQNRLTPMQGSIVEVTHRPRETCPVETGQVHVKQALGSAGAEIFDEMKHSNGPRLTEGDRFGWSGQSVSPS